jgi:hypothetical protein
MATRRFGPDEGLGYAPQGQPLTRRELLEQRDDALRRLAAATKRIDDLEDIELGLRGELKVARHAATPAGIALHGRHSPCQGCTHGPFDSCTVGALIGPYVDCRSRKEQGLTQTEKYIRSTTGDPRQPCTDPDSMHGAGDGFGGTDDQGGGMHSPAARTLLEDDS